MKVSQILSSPSKPFPSLEIVPPLGGISRRELLDSIRPLMEFSPRYINVTCHREEYEYHRGSDGSYTRQTVRRRISESAVCGAVQSEFKVEVVPHVICGGADASHIETQLQDFRFMEIDNLMALRGDSTLGERRFTPEPGGYSHASELVAAIRRSDADAGAPGHFCIGVGAYPEKHFEAPNIDEDIANLKRKVDAGADYIITQMFFDNRVYYSFVDRCRQAGISVPIIPGLKPLSTVRHLSLLPETFSIDIPQELTSEVRRLAHDPDAVYQTGLEWCRQQVTDLLAHGVRAVHFYTMGRSGNIIEILRQCF